MIIAITFWSLCLKLLLGGSVFAVSNVPFGPALWDLNESASSDGNSHPAKHRIPPQGILPLQRSISPALQSSNSVNNKIGALKDSGTSSDGQIQPAPSMMRYNMRGHRSKISYANLQNSSSSSSAASHTPDQRDAPRQGKRKQTKCEIHRPGCDHWHELDRTIRKQKKSRFQQSLRIDRKKQKIDLQQESTQSGRKRDLQKRREWERNRIATMNPREKKRYLKRKAEVMRGVRARQKLAKENQKEAKEQSQSEVSSHESHRPTKKMKSLSDLSEKQE